MPLTFNAKTGDFVIVSADKKKADEVGLTLSTSARGPNGEPVWFTKTPYAALAYFKEADEKAKQRLSHLQKDYEWSWAVDWPTSYPVPQGLEPRAFQRAGVAYARAHRNCLIGDEPGLGKSGQAIGVSNAEKLEKNLIICPASIRLNWQKEIKKWSTIPGVRTHPILKASDGVSSWSNYEIVSYELTRNEALHAALCDVKWDSIVIDEAHYLKTPDAERTRAIFGGGRKNMFNKSNVLADRADRIIALTGTPLPNRPRECFTLAKALYHESVDWMHFEDFTYRFNPAGRLENKDTGAIYNREEKGRLPELQARLRCNFMIRRLKQDVLKDLPDKQYEFSFIEPDGAIREVLRREKMLHFDLKDLKNPMAEIWGEISTIRREMGMAKLPRAIEHIKYLMDIEELPKLVVFSHHKSVMDEFKKQMAEYGVVEVRGGMSSGAKNSAVERFISDPDCRIFHGQLEAAGFGIDGLQKVCQRVVFVEAAWTPGTNEQAVDRCHRIGQKDSVLAQFLVVEGSLDERVLATVLEKTKTIHASLDKGIR